MSSKKSKVNILTKIAILSALAFLVMFFEVPLWFAPPFYKIDFSEVIALIGAFALGPLAGAAIEALKIVLDLIFRGTTTAYIGELSNLIIGLSLILPAAAIYRKHKSKRAALIGMAVGTLGIVIVGTALNYFLLLPAYSYFYHLPLEDLIALGTAVNPRIVNKLTLVLLATAPFNLIKGLLDSLIVALIYKKVSPILHK